MNNLFRTAALSVALMVSIGGLQQANAGEQYINETVRARITDVFTMHFSAGVPVRIGLQGDGDTDLDLIVRDENNNVIAEGLGATDREYVTFTPAWAGRFTVRVRNLGDVYNAYRMLVRQGSATPARFVLPAH